LDKITKGVRTGRLIGVPLPFPVPEPVPAPIPEPVPALRSMPAPRDLESFETETFSLLFFAILFGVKGFPSNLILAKNLSICGLFSGPAEA
jgi:hypothetical protein